MALAQPRCFCGIKHNHLLQSLMFFAAANFLRVLIKAFSAEYSVPSHCYTTHLILFVLQISLTAADLSCYRHPSQACHAADSLL